MRVIIIIILFYVPPLHINSLSMAHLSQPRGNSSSSHCLGFTQRISAFREFHHILIVAFLANLHVCLLSVVLWVGESHFFFAPSFPLKKKSLSQVYSLLELLWQPMKVQRQHVFLPSYYRNKTGEKLFPSLQATP